MDIVVASTAENKGGLIVKASVASKFVVESTQSNKNSLHTTVLVHCPWRRRF
jgi:hypothetical protein